MKHMASGREILMDTRAKESTLDAIRRIIERDECEIDDAIRTYVEKRRWDGVETDFDEIAGYINEIIGAEV